MAGLLTAADKAAMKATTLDIIDDWGVTATVERGKRSAAGQVDTWSTLLSNQRIYIEPASAATIAILDAPGGNVFVGYMNTPTTALQEGDRLIVGSARYTVIGLLPYASHLELQLTRADAFTNG